MGKAEHEYDGTMCEMCSHQPCQFVIPQTVKVPRYPEVCPHPQDMLLETFQRTCDPGVVTVCTRCGLSFPGLVKEDLLVA